MIVKKKICKGKGKYKNESGCGALTYIFSNGLCKDCANRVRFAESPTSHKPSTYRYKRKVTGELDLFEKIWQERPHVSEISGKRLFDRSHKLWINQFMHIRSKGADPSNRLNPNNIILATWEEHYLYDHQTHKVKSNQEWKWVFDLLDKIKSESSQHDAIKKEFYKRQLNSDKL